MKKFLFLIALLPSLCWAREDFSKVTKPNEHVSLGVNLSSNTAASTGPGGVSVSSFTAGLHTVTVNVASIGGFLDIYDATRSTDPTTTNARKIARIDTSARGVYIFDVVCTSGLAINNQGGPAADVTLMYRER